MKKLEIYINGKLDGKFTSTEKNMEKVIPDGFFWGDILGGNYFV